MHPRLESWLGRGTAQWLFVAVGVGLATPSIDTGLVADDHFQAIAMRATSPLPGIAGRGLDLFTFASGNPAATHALQDVGVFPWWADVRVRLAFFRPLSALTHRLDHLLFPRSPAWAHVHSLLWFGLALAVARAFYRRFLEPSSTAGLALLLYAIDDAHGPAVGWIANRNALVALALALPTLIFHDAAIRDGDRRARWLAPVSLALGLLSGESAIAVVGYLVAYEIHLAREPLRFRAARLSPYAVVLIAWRIAYVRLGFGALGSGLYLDPAHDSLAFLAALPSRGVFLLAGQLALPWSDFASLYPMISPRAAWIMTGVAATVVLALAAAFAPLWRRVPTARFFATGMLLSVVPIAATFPADRLLSFVGIGGMGLVALFLSEVRTGAWRAVTAAGLIGLHGILAPPLALLRSRSMVTVDRPLRVACDTIPATPEVARQTVVLVNPPADLFAGYIAAMRVSRGEVLPARIRWLWSGTSAVRIERTSQRTLRVRSEAGFFANSSERLLRSLSHPMQPGDEVALTGMTARIVSVRDARPLEVEFAFQLPLDDATLRFMRWTDAGYAPWVIPPVGTAVVLPPNDFLRATFGGPPRGR